MITFDDIYHTKYQVTYTFVVVARLLCTLAAMYVVVIMIS